MSEGGIDIERSYHKLMPMTLPTLLLCTLYLGYATMLLNRISTVLRLFLLKTKQKKTPHTIFKSIYKDFHIIGKLFDRK